MASREILTFLTLIPARLNVRSNFIHCNSKKQRRSSPEVGEIRLKKNTPICFRFGRDALKTPVTRLRRLSITQHQIAVQYTWVGKKNHGGLMHALGFTFWISFEFHCSHNL